MHEANKLKQDLARFFLYHLSPKDLNTLNQAFDGY